MLNIDSYRLYVHQVSGTPNVHFERALLFEQVLLLALHDQLFDPLVAGIQDVLRTTSVHDSQDALRTRPYRGSRDVPCTMPPYVSARRQRVFFERALLFEQVLLFELEQVERLWQVDDIRDAVGTKPRSDSRRVFARQEQDSERPFLFDTVVFLP